MKLLKTIGHRLGLISCFSVNKQDKNAQNVYVVGMTELFTNKTSLNDRNSFKEFDEAILILIENKILGGIFYDYSVLDIHNLLFVRLTFVYPEFRKNGLYYLLHKELDNIMIEKKIDGCLSWQHVNNKSMENLKHKVGYQEVMKLYKRGLLDEIRV